MLDSFNWSIWLINDMLFPLIQVHSCSNGNLHDSLRMYRAWIWWWYGPMWGCGVMVFCVSKIMSWIHNVFFFFENSLLLHKWLNVLLVLLQPWHVMNRSPPQEKNGPNYWRIDLSLKTEFWLKIRRADINVFHEHIWHC